MKAMLMREPGGPDVLAETELPVPEIEHPTEVLVRLRALQSEYEDRAEPWLDRYRAARPRTVPGQCAALHCAGD